MIRNTIRCIFCFVIMFTITCGFTALKLIKQENIHQYVHEHDCKKHNPLVLDCFNTCYGFQPFAEEHQHDENDIDVSYPDYLFPVTIYINPSVTEIKVHWNIFTKHHAQLVVLSFLHPPLV